VAAYAPGTAPFAGGIVPAGNILSLNGLATSTTWVITFTGGTGVTGHSIADGVYDTAMTDGSISQNDTFYRLFGDSKGTGTGSVNSLVDNARFKKALGSANGQAAYVAYFDYDANGTINSLVDFAQFKKRLGTAFSGFTPTI